MFSYEFVTNSADPDSTLRQLRKLLAIVLDLAGLVRREKPALPSQQLCMLAIRCCVESLDREWIAVEGLF